MPIPNPGVKVACFSSCTSNWPKGLALLFLLGPDEMKSCAEWMSELTELSSGDEGAQSFLECRVP